MSAPILLPLDGSDFAAQATSNAIGLARRLGAPLHVVAVYQPVVVVGTIHSAATFDRRYDDEQKAGMKEAIRKRAESIAAETGLEVTYAALEGSQVGEVLLKEAASTGTRMIVAATHGRGGLERFWLGSVADTLVRSATLPVLLIRPRDPAEGAPEGEPAPFRRVLLPLDGSPLAEEAIQPALDTLVAEGGSVRLLRVVRVPATRLPVNETYWTPLEAEGIADRKAEAVAYLEDVARNLLPSSVDVSAEVAVHAAPATAILDEAGSWGADAVAMCTHAREGFQRDRKSVV